jgi:hypothetical protein
VANKKLLRVVEDRRVDVLDVASPLQKVVQLLILLAPREDTTDEHTTKKDDMRRNLFVAVVVVFVNIRDALGVVYECFYELRWRWL